VGEDRSLHIPYSEGYFPWSVWRKLLI
jgi:hypothetical protein